jgi:hypothetical protein
VAIEELIVVYDHARGGQSIDARAAIDVGFVLAGEVAALEGIVGPIRDPSKG